MDKYILSIDQGTTNSRAMLFDQNAKVVSTAQKELELFYPQNGWVEQNPEQIWDDVKSVCKKALTTLHCTSEDVAAIGITNQRETLVLWHKTSGKPVGRAIVWQDRRTADYCQELKDMGHEEMIRAKTGLLLDPYFSGTKLKWMLDNIPGARAEAERGELLCGTIDCFLLWNLTGGDVHATDATNASRTMLFNIVEQKWDLELLELLGIPENLLPEVKDNSGDFGVTKSSIFGTEIPITGMAGDQQAALFGQACFEPGMIKSTYGTGCFALMNIGTQFKTSQHRLLTTVAYRLNGETFYAIEGSIFMAGAVVQWLRDGLGIVKHASKTEEMAQTVDDNGGVYLVPAFTGLGAPYWQPEARGTITGMTRDSNANHIVRAALEAQAYQTQDLMQAMQEDTGQKLKDLRIDGGMVENNWVCQFLSDIIDISVQRPEVIETTALGVAYLAGLHVGFFPSLDHISASWKCSKRFTPQMDADDRNILYTGWKKAVRQTLA